VVRVDLERRRRVPLARAEALHARSRLVPRVLELVAVEQLAEVGIGFDDRDGLLRGAAHERNRTRDRDVGTRTSACRRRSP
jgi:hypothetical protein